MYHVKATLATTKRIVQQLSHDHRSIALIFLAPILLMSLLYWLFSDQKYIFNTIAPALLGIFPFVIMFLITSITTLRERSSGTLERLMTMRVSKLDIILGYAVAFGTLGLLQSLVVSAVAVGPLNMIVAGPLWFVIVMAALDTLLGVALGLFVSAFARTEFQAVQFMPALILPQFLVCGLLLPLDKMPTVLEHIAYGLPLTYAVDALQQVVRNVGLTSEAIRDVLFVAAFIVGLIMLGSLTLKRRTN